MPSEKSKKNNKKKLQNSKITHIDSSMNLKYLSRCHYYGKLIDMDYTEGGALVIKLSCYVATSCTGNVSSIRLYVPTDMENEIINYLNIGENYYVISAPYRVSGMQKFSTRVDLVLNIFKELY